MFFFSLLPNQSTLTYFIPFSLSSAQDGTANAAATERGVVPAAKRRYRCTTTAGANDQPKFGIRYDSISC